jgi:hypothetical protein
MSDQLAYFGWGCWAFVIASLVAGILIGAGLVLILLWIGLF